MDYTSFFLEKAADILLGRIAEVGYEKMEEEIREKYHNRDIEDPLISVEELVKIYRREKSFLEKLYAEMHFADRSGLIFLGPSGAGKTHIKEIILNKRLGEIKSTKALSKEFFYFGSRCTAIYDTVGDFMQYAFALNSPKAVRPRQILVLVFAFGHLATVGQNGFRRKGMKDKDIPKSFDEYHEYTLNEELDWLRGTGDLFWQLSHTPTIEDIFIVINKRDLWSKDQKLVHDHYGVQRTQNGAYLKISPDVSFIKEIERWQQILKVPDKKVRIVETSAVASDFEPCPNLVREQLSEMKCTKSIDFLRAAIEVSYFRALKRRSRG